VFGRYRDSEEITHGGTHSLPSVTVHHPLVPRAGSYDYHSD
jgi:hypothetical protein